MKGHSCQLRIDARVVENLDFLVVVHSLLTQARVGHHLHKVIQASDIFDLKCCKYSPMVIIRDAVVA